MEKKYNFVYLTTNLINGKQYVGDHSTDNLNCCKSKNYLGSGRPYFNNAKKKYGKENFIRKDLEFFSTKKEAFDAQERYIAQFNTLIPNGYNLSPKGGLGNIGCFSEETKQKIRESHLGKKASEETKKKLRELNVGNKHPMFGKHKSEETKTKIGKARKGIKHSEDSIIKISTNTKKAVNQLKSIIKNKKSHLNKIPWNKGIKSSPETIEKMKKALKGRISPRKGVKLSKGTKEKISKSKLGKPLNRNNKIYSQIISSVNLKKIRCSYCNREFNPGNYGRYHGNKCKLNI